MEVWRDMYNPIGDTGQVMVMLVPDSPRACSNSSVLDIATSNDLPPNQVTYAPKADRTLICMSTYHIHILTGPTNQTKANSFDSPKAFILQYS